MATRHEKLLDAVEANIGASASIDASKVYRNRVEILEASALPAVVIQLGADEPLSDLGATNVKYIDWELLLFVDIYVATTVASIDPVFLALRRSIHAALMADGTQGLAWVFMTIPMGADAPLIDDEGQQKTAVYRTKWIFRIRTDIADIED